VRQERVTGEFSRSIELPKAVNADGVSANFKDGILSVSLPIQEEAKPKKITIKN
ncbi:MAG: Hsp20 family protein, partial [Leptospirales bacterium]